MFYLLFFVPIQPMLVFLAFTFTDVEDFCPLMSLIVGAIGVFWLAHKKENKISGATTAILFLLSLWPILPTVGLFFLAREFQAVHGAWPQVMVNDPKIYVNFTSPNFERLFSLVTYLQAFAGAWSLLFFGLYFSIRSHLSASQRRWCSFSFWSSLLLLIIDPGNIYEWWMD